MSKSQSYKPCNKHCKADCFLLDIYENEPCWGQVNPYGISGDDDFCHACEGHYGRAEGNAKYEPEIQITHEQQEELREAINIAIRLFHELGEALVDACKIFIERVREIALSLAWFFLKSQLREWKIPNRIADFISRNTPWEWAWWIGLRWLRRKYALIE